MAEYRVFVVGGGYEYIKLLYDLGYSGAKSPDEADFVLFTGGEDVDPQLYGEVALKGTYINPERDRREMVIYKFCKDKTIPMVGVCRGGQFLNVMNGGRLWQHINNHGIAGTHPMLEILPKGSNKKPRLLNVTSTHHQQMIPASTGRILGVGVMDEKGTPISSEKIGAGSEISGKEKTKHPDVEIVLYPKTHCLCFQPHPEYKTAPKELKEYFDELLMEHTIPYC